MLSRGVVEMFISAHGLFSDVWAAWAELILNITFTLWLAPIWGIVGILLGKIISVLFIAMFWKPYFLFSKGLKLSVSKYWRGMLPYYALFTIFCGFTLTLKHYWIDSHVTSLYMLCISFIFIYIPFLTLYFISQFILTKGMKYFIARKPKIYKLLTRYTNV